MNQRHMPGNSRIRWKTRRVWIRLGMLLSCLCAVFLWQAPHGASAQSGTAAEPPVVLGTEGDDVLVGGSDENIIIGGPGNDQIFPGSPAGAVANGGPGDDIYVFSPGDGPFGIEDPEGNDQVRFGPGIRQEDLEVTVRGGLLTVLIKNQPNATSVPGLLGPYHISVLKWGDPGKLPIEVFRLADGTSFRALEFERLTKGNRRPILLKPFDDVTVKAGTKVTIPLPVESFEDPEGEPLTISASVLNERGRFASIGLLKKMGNYPLQGTVASHAAGRYLVMVSGVDPQGLSAVDEFTLTVTE